jgi:hypothetical protein
MAVELLAGNRIEGESNKAVIACNDYLRMGAGRSLPSLLERYTNCDKTQPPTGNLSSLKVWSTTYAWVERAAIYDKVVEDEKTAQVETRRRAIMESGLTQDYERVTELTELYEKLKLEFVLGGLWYTDIKLSATGERVEVEVFNRPLIDSMRATLDDIAKETGGRKQKVDMQHSGEIGTKVIEGPKDVR